MWQSGRNTKLWRRKPWIIRCRGFYRGANVELARQLSPLVRTERGKVLAEEFITFVTEQSAQAQDQERLPGSSEVLESSFGKFKFWKENKPKEVLRHLFWPTGPCWAERPRTPLSKLWPACKPNTSKPGVSNTLARHCNRNASACEVSFAGCSRNKTRKNTHDLEAHIFNSPG